MIRSQVARVEELDGGIGHGEFRSIYGDDCEEQFLEKTAPLWPGCWMHVHMEGYPGGKEVGDKAWPNDSECPAAFWI